MEETTIPFIVQNTSCMACDLKVQVIKSCIRQKLGERDCWLANISDGVHYIAVFFLVQPGKTISVHSFYKIQEYQSLFVPSRKILIESYEADGFMDKMMGSPEMMDVQLPDPVVSTVAAAAPVYEEDACKSYEEVIVGQTSASISICGRLLSHVTEKAFNKRDGGRGLILSFSMFHRGKCAKVSVFDTQLQNSIRSLKLGDCVIMSKFKTEAPNDYAEGAVVAITLNRDSDFRVFQPIHLFDELHRIDTHVMPDVDKKGRYVTLLVRVDECGEVTQTRNGKEMRKLTLRDGGRNSIQVSLFGDNTKRPFVQNGIVLLANVKVEYNEYSHAQTINISPYTSFVIFDLSACGDIITQRAAALASGKADDNNGGLPDDAPDEYGVHDPL